MKNSRAYHYTLLEMLVVMSITGILFAATARSFSMAVRPVGNRCETPQSLRKSWFYDRSGVNSCTAMEYLP